MHRTVPLFLFLGLAIAIAAPTAAVAEMSKTDTAICKNWYEDTRAKGRDACFYVARNVEWTSPSFQISDKCDTWEKFAASGSKSSSNYGACNFLCPQGASRPPQPLNCPAVKP
ncbi:MAG: hypothetical protein VW405_00040 [Rhodospirillaceae bacterium]